MEPSFWILVPMAVVASLLTLISGFGLGTLLLPVFAVFVPLEMAVAMTAVVHVLNNFFKFGLLYRSMDRGTLLWFGIPGILGAWLGAELMLHLGRLEPLYSGIRHDVGPLAVLIAGLMIVFALTELSPSLSGIAFPRSALLPGGLISGFFGGLSGHQGALRSMFLIRSGLDKKAYIATGVAIALLVDITRIPVYWSGMPSMRAEEWWMVATATLAAFLGAWWGKQLIPKITLRAVQLLVGLLMLVIALGLASGAI